MDDLRTKRQRELDQLRNEQREDLSAIRAAGVKPFLEDAPEGMLDPTLSELALRREARTRRTGAVAQTFAMLFNHLDSRAVLDVVRRLHPTTAGTRAIVTDLQQDLYEREAPTLDAQVLGPYVILIEAAEAVAPAPMGSPAPPSADE